MFVGRRHNKVENPYKLKHFYSFYMNEVKGNRLYEVEFTLYKALVGECFKRVMVGILYDNKFFKMPYSLGTISVQKRKVNLATLRGHPSRVDWETTNKIGKITYHLNEHSHNYRYWFRWDRRRAQRKNLRFYKLTMTRQNKRLLAKLIKSGKYDYFEAK